MADRVLPSPEVLRQLLDYNPATGGLTWRERPASLFTTEGKRTQEEIAVRWNTRLAGKPALTANSHGYRSGRIFDRDLLAHRVIWALVHGHWPEQQIDHINGVRSDNRLCNLRLVTDAENRVNAALSRRNTSGVVGVYQHKSSGRWFAMICRDKKQRNLGYFDTKEEAVAARKAAEVRLGFHPNHGRAPVPLRSA